MLSEIGFASGFKVALFALELFGLIVVFVEIVLPQRVFVVGDKVAFVTFVHLFCLVNLLMNLQSADGKKRRQEALGVLINAFLLIFAGPEPCLCISI